MRRFLVIILAVLLTAVLAFLVYMTQSVDFGRQVRVNALLGDLRELDAGWNESVLRSRTEFLADPEMLRVSRDRLDSWFDEVAGTLGGASAIKTVQDLVGHAASFDLSALKDVPPVDLPDLLPFFQSLLALLGIFGGERD